MADQLPAGLSSPSAFISVRVHVFDRPTAQKPKYQLRVRLPRASTFADLFAEVTRRVLAASDTSTHDSLVASAALRYADGTELRLDGELAAQMRWDEAVYIFPRAAHQPRPRPPGVLPPPPPPPPPLPPPSSSFSFPSSSSSSPSSSSSRLAALPVTPVKQMPGYPSARAAAAGVGSQPPRHPGRTHAATPSRPPRREIASQKATSASPTVSRRGSLVPGAAGLLDSRVRARRRRGSANAGTVGDNPTVYNHNSLDEDDDEKETAGVSACATPRRKSSSLLPFAKGDGDMMDDDKTTPRTARNSRLQGASLSSHATNNTIYDIYDPPEYEDAPPSIKKATPLGKGTLRCSPSDGTSPAVKSPSTPRTPREGHRALQDITSKDNKKAVLSHDGEEQVVANRGKQSGAMIKTEQGQASEKTKGLKGNYAFKTQPSQSPLASQHHLDSKAGLHQATAVYEPRESIQLRREAERLSWFPPTSQTPSAEPTRLDHTLDYIALSSDSDDVDDYEWEKILRYGSPQEAKTAAMAATMSRGRSRPSSSPVAEKKPRSVIPQKRVVPTASSRRTKSVPPPSTGAANFEPDDTADVIPESPPSNSGAEQFSSHAGGEALSDDDDNDDASDLSLDEVTARNTRLNSGSPKKRRWITTRTRAGVKRKLQELSDSESSEPDEDEEEEEDEEYEGEEDDDEDTEEDEHEEDEEEDKEQNRVTAAQGAEAATSAPDARIKSEASDPEQSVAQPPPRPPPFKPTAPSKRSTRVKNVSPSRRGRRRKRRDNKERGQAPATASDEQMVRRRIARRRHLVEADGISASTPLAGHNAGGGQPPLFTSSQQDGFDNVPKKQVKAANKAKKSRRKRHSGHYTIS